jgi:hypothetical protein
MNYDKFHVIAVISNPVQYRSRYSLFDIFQEDIERKGGRLWTVEMQTGARPHVVTDAENPQSIQVWNSALPGELWHKENLINVGIQHLTRQCPDWRYVAWVDADVKFEAGALEKTVQALQHWDVVQMWSHAIDFGPDSEIIGKPHLSFMYAHWNDIQINNGSSYAAGGHPGYAWAARRDALNKLGGLVDFGVLGSADRHMACALVGKVEQSVHGDCHSGYHRALKNWQDRSEFHIRRNAGYVTGSIRHLWHGRKASRGYASRPI